MHIFHVVVLGSATDDDAAQVTMIAPRLWLIGPLHGEPLLAVLAVLALIDDVFLLSAIAAFAAAASLRFFLVQPHVPQQESPLGERLATELTRVGLHVDAFFPLGLFGRVVGSISQ